MTLTITEENVNKRLDKFLKELYPAFSRSYIQKTIEAGQVLVNGKTVAAHHFLKIGNTVEINIEAPKEVMIASNPDVKIDVVAETQDFLIINKPTGLVVHQGEGHKEADTLVNGLIARFPEIAKVGEDLMRPGIVHRLDGDASGVMVVARTQKMFDSLKEQFKLRKTKKEYLAVLYGKVSPAEGMIEFAIEHSGAKMVARPKGEEGKKAETEYETISANDNFSLVRVRTHTGRSHQIRVHFFAKGNPVVGDEIYKLKVKNEKLKVVEAKRLMLHAQKLGFHDLAGQWQEYEIPAPKEFFDFTTL